MADDLDLAGRIPCPCCGYPTLSERGAYEICELCNWEDDGQVDDEADQVMGGPNGPYSLREARCNFKQYLTKYAPERDTRIAPDTVRERSIKVALRAAFDRLAAARPDQRAEATADVRKCEADLASELAEKVRHWETTHRMSGRGDR
jgi:hypothetical protein